MSDVQLLRAYAGEGRESAFREIVRRHTDLVYASAWRQLETEAAAADITQSVFVDLARKARAVSEQISVESSLAGWLHRSTRYAVLNHLRDTRRRLTHERQAMEQLLTDAEPAANWEQIRPLLDEALDQLDDANREALLLRFFKNRDYRTVGAALGVSDDTAQKRVTRALETLRDHLSRHGIRTTAAALSLTLTANAIQAAPAGLIATISAAALLTGTTASTSAIIAAAATKTIAMTTLQKTLVTITIATLAGVGIYEAKQAHEARAVLQKLQQQQAPLAEQIRQLQNDHGNSTKQLADLLAENSHLKSISNQNELLKLRGQVGLLRAQASQQAKLEREPAIADFAKSSQQMQEILKSSVAASYDKVYAKLFADLNLSPDQVSSLKQLLSDKLTAGLAEKGLMMTRKMSSEQIQQLKDQINTKTAGVDEQIRQTLGADGFAAFQAYEKTYNERSQIVGPMGFSDQLTGSMELTSDQTEQLVQAMSDERQQYKFTVDYSDPSKYSGDMATFYSDASIGQYQKELEQLHQLYLARAQTILTPDQQTAFQKFLSNRLVMQNMGLNMTAKIVGGKSGDK